MAVTAVGTNHALAVKLYAKRLDREALAETFAGRFMGTTKDSLIYVRDDMQKSAGDQVTYGLRMQLSGNGVQGDSTLEGNEEGLTLYNDALVINQLRHAVRSGGRMTDQRIPWSVRDEALDGLRDWWADRIDTAFANHMAGNTGQADTRFTGNNATTAPTTNSIIYGPLDATTENSLSASESASADFQLTMIDKAVTRAKTMNQQSTTQPLIRPIRTGSGPKFVAFLHPYQVYNLKTDATAARVTWYDAQKQRVAGGEMNNGIFNGMLGEYNQTIIHEWTRVPLATGTTTVRRAVFAGAQAIGLAFGRENSAERFTWVEELFDFQNQLGVAAGTIFGMKKTVYNSLDFGTIVLASHAEAP